MVQRYSEYILLVKDFGDEAQDMPDYPADYPVTAGWLLAADSWSSQPLAVMPPADHAEWCGSAWSMVIARGAVEDVPDKRLDMAPRIYLLEEGGGARLWATRRIDELASGLQPPTFQSRSHFHHLIDFSAEIEEAGAAPRSLWSLDLHYAARILQPGDSAGKLWYWRCDIVYNESLALLRT